MLVGCAPDGGDPGGTAAVPMAPEPVAAATADGPASQERAATSVAAGAPRPAGAGDTGPAQVPSPPPSPSAPPPAGPDAGPGAAPPSAGPWFTIASAEAGLTHRDLSGPLPADGKRYLLDCIGRGVAVLDADGDGRLDLFFAQGRGPDGSTVAADGTDARDRLYRNLGGRRFEEIGAQVGIDDDDYGFGALAFDQDNDGDTDLFVTNLGRNRLYRNDGGRFTDATADHPGLAGPPDAWSTGAAAADVDADGDLDLYVCNYMRHDAAELDRKGLCRFMTECRIPCGPLGLEPQPDVFFRNAGPPDFRLEEATADAGLAQETRYGFQPLFVDVDADGDQDLFVTNDSRPNFLFVNDGHGRFSEQGVIAGVAYGNAGQAESGMGAAAGDLQGDGLPELYVTTFSTQMKPLYVNRTAAAGRLWFDEQSRPSGTGSPTYFKLSWGCAIADFDDDGRPDLFTAHGHVYPQVDDCAPPEIRYRQENTLFLGTAGPRLRLADAGPGARAACGGPASHRGSAAADLDDDGRLDLVVNRLDEPPFIAWNSAPHPGHWLTLTLELAGPPAHTAIGARVLAQVGDQRWSAAVHAGSSFLSTEDPRVHLGLGAAAALDSLTVLFPDGSELTLHDVAADRHLRIRSGDARAVEVPRPAPPPGGSASPGAGGSPRGRPGGGGLR